jgi:uncharacterized protein
MLLTIRSYNNTPYLYDSRTNDLYRIDEEVFSELNAAGCDVPKVKSDRIRKNLEEAQISNTPVPLQTPEEFEKENTDAGLGFVRITLDVTHTCNLRCKYCIYSGNYRSERTHENKMMTIAVADKILDGFFAGRKGNLQPRTVIFYGGEPLTNFPVVKHVVERASGIKNDTAFAVTTNGLMLENDDILDFLVKHKFIINISFDGPAQEKVRVDIEGKGTLGRLMGVIEKISRKYPELFKEHVGFNVTVTGATDMPQTVKFFNTNPLFAGKTLNIIRVYDEDGSYVNKYGLQEGDLALNKAFEQMRLEYPALYTEKLPFHDGALLATMAKLNKRQMGGKKSMPLNSCCFPGLNTAFFDIDGTICACERTEHSPIGHIDRGGIDAVAAAELVRKYYAIAKNHCPSCWCQNLCPKCFSHVKRGIITEENFVETCDKFRATTQAALRVFLTIKEKDPKAFDDIKEIVNIQETDKDI